MMYVYQVTQRHMVGALYFSSWMKAYRYCQDNGAWNRKHEDEYVTQMTSDNGETVFEIRKEKVR